MIISINLEAYHNRHIIILIIIIRAFKRNFTTF